MLHSESPRSVIVTPDYQGKALTRNSEGQFTDEFTQALVGDSCHTQRVWMVGINGLPAEQISAIAKNVRGNIGALCIDPIICEEKGIIPTLDKCYQHAIKNYPGVPLLIRKDGREHPQSAVNILENLVPSQYDHIGVSLTYEEGMLGHNDRKGDVDLRAITKDELGFELSHAHGMQGVAMQDMPEVHATMLQIKQMMQERYGIRLAWGYDLLIRLVSVLNGKKYTEIEVPAIIAREDRPTEKIKTQIDNWGKVVTYGKALFEEAHDTVTKK